MAVGALNRASGVPELVGKRKMGCRCSPFNRKRFKPSLLGRFPPCVGIKTIFNIVFEKVEAIRGAVCGKTMLLNSTPCNYASSSSGHIPAQGIVFFIDKPCPRGVFPYPALADFTDTGTVRVVDDDMSASWTPQVNHTREESLQFLRAYTRQAFCLHFFNVGRGAWEFLGKARTHRH